VPLILPVVGPCAERNGTINANAHTAAQVIRGSEQ
jgi:hypothetical protein